MSRVNSRSATITVNSVEYSAQVTDIEITSKAASSSGVTFADVRNGTGGRTYGWKMTLQQDTVAGSLHDLVWSHAGEIATMSIFFNGGTARSISTPEFTGFAIIAEPDGTLLGGAASIDNNIFTIDVEWKSVDSSGNNAKPVRHSS
jgi:hypothetical protein